MISTNALNIGLEFSTTTWWHLNTDSPLHKAMSVRIPDFRISLSRSRDPFSGSGWGLAQLILNIMRRCFHSNNECLLDAVAPRRCYWCHDFQFLDGNENLYHGYGQTLFDNIIFMIIEEMVGEKVMCLFRMRMRMVMSFGSRFWATKNTIEIEVDVAMLAVSGGFTFAEFAK